MVAAVQGMIRTQPWQTGGEAAIGVISIRRKIVSYRKNGDGKAAAGRRGEARAGCRQHVASRGTKGEVAKDGDAILRGDGQRSSKAGSPCKGKRDWISVRRYGISTGVLYCHLNGGRDRCLGKRIRRLHHKRQLHRRGDGKAGAGR